MSISIYTCSFDPILFSVIYADNFGAIPLHGHAHRGSAVNIVEVVVSESLGVCDGASVDVPEILALYRDDDVSAEAEFRQRILERLLHDAELSPRDVQVIPNGSFILFVTLNQIYQKLIQSNLNAKHGESNSKQTSLIYDEHTEFRCCWIGDDDEAACMRPEHAVYQATIELADGSTKKIFSFSTRRQDELALIRDKVLWCCNFRRLFSTRDEYVTNFCRFFYWQYSGELLCRNDMLFFTLFLLAQNSFICGGLSRNAIKRLVNHPLLSIFSGGFIESITKADVTRVDDIATPPLDRHAILDRLLRTPPKIGTAAKETCRWQF